jgi:hypothetical protein
MLGTGIQAFTGSPRARFECARMLEPIVSDCTTFAGEVEPLVGAALTAIAATTTQVLNSRRSGNFFNDFAISGS